MECFLSVCVIPSVGLSIQQGHAKHVRMIRVCNNDLPLAFLLSMFLDIFLDSGVIQRYWYR